jgi:DNA-binding Xre family transcriptional regulator
MNKKHIGSDFDDFLKGEKIYEQAQAAAIKRVVAYQIAEEMKKKKLTKTEMASRMKTSRAALERLLDPENASITLFTLERAASALGKRLTVQLG